MGNDEGVQNWYRLGTSRRPRAIGEAMADLVVGGLLVDGQRRSTTSPPRFRHCY